MQCKCGDTAVLRTTKKEGPNFGKQFYTCPNNGKCKFFSWVDGNSSYTKTSSYTNRSSKPRELNPNLPSIVPKCPTHGSACLLKTTKKEGINQGRNFFVCPESTSVSRCFFIWEDEFKPDDSNSLNMASEITHKCTVNFEAISDDTLEIVLPEEIEYLRVLKPLVKEIQGSVFVEENICTVPMLKKGELKHKIEQLPEKFKVNDVPDTLFHIIKAFPQIDVTDEKNIGDEMGLGKTIQAIAISFYFNEDWPLLIICPASLRVNWSVELEHWLSPWIKPQDINIIIHGKANVDSKINIISYDLAAGNMKTKILEKKFKSILIDECHYLKNPDTARYEIISPYAKAAKRCILITGTPALSRPNELFTQLDMILSSKLTWFNKYQFGYRYCDATQTIFGFEDKGASNLHELNFLLTRTVMLRRLKDEVLTDLPPKVRHHVYITVDEKFKTDLRKGLAKLQQNSSSISSAINVQEHHDKKFENQVEYSQLFQLTGEAKIKYVLHYLEGVIESKTKFLIFAHHLKVLDAIEGFVNKHKVGYMRIDGSTATLDRQKKTDKFQKDPECLVAILSIKAAGTGLTLHAASHVIFAELMWNPGELFQAEDRVHRVGQKNSVTITYLLGKDTLDDIIWTKIKNKLDVVENSLNGITNTDIIQKKIEIDSSNNEIIIHEEPSSVQIIEDDSDDDLEALDELDRIEKEFLEKEKQKQKQKVSIKNYSDKFKDVQVTSANLFDFMYIPKDKKFPYNVTHNKDGTINQEIANAIQKKLGSSLQIETTPLPSKKRKIIEDTPDEKPTEKFTKRKLFPESVNTPKVIEEPKDQKEEPIIQSEFEITPKKNLPTTPTKQDDVKYDFEKFAFSPKVSPLTKSKNERLARLHKFKEQPKGKITIPKEYQKDLDL